MPHPINFAALRKTAADFRNLAEQYPAFRAFIFDGGDTEQNVPQALLKKSAAADLGAPDTEDVRVSLLTISLPNNEPQTKRHLFAYGDVDAVWIFRTLCVFAGCCLDDYFWELEPEARWIDLFVRFGLEPQELGISLLERRGLADTRDTYLTFLCHPGIACALLAERMVRSRVVPESPADVRRLLDPPSRSEEKEPPQQPEDSSCQRSGNQKHLIEPIPRPDFDVWALLSPEEIRREIKLLVDRCQAVVDRAKQENRELTAEEAFEIDGILGTENQPGRIQTLEESLIRQQRLERYQSNTKADEGLANACQIPPEFQSRPLSYREAGMIHRRGIRLPKVTGKKAGEYMRQCVQEELLPCLPCPPHKYKHIFDVRSFAESVQPEVRREHNNAKNDPKTTPKRRK